MADPERSSKEILTLCRTLGSKSSSEKEKLRRIKLFRAYVQPSKSTQSTPEFYDDDVTTLFLGSKEGEFAVPGLVACSSEMQSSKNRLSKVAVAVLSLIKYLTLDFQEIMSGKKVETEDGDLNVFAETFALLTRVDMQQMKFDTHLITMVDNNRGNNAKHKKETCLLIAFLLINHESSEDDDDVMDGGDHTSDLFALEELLVTEDSRAIFKGWLSSKDADAIAVKKAVSKTFDRKACDADPAVDTNDKEEVISKPVLFEDNSEENSVSKWNNSDVLVDLSNAPTKWANSKIAQEMANLLEKDGGAHAQLQSLKEDENEMLEQRAREEAVQRELARDPLNIRQEDDFDLRLIEARRGQIYEEIRLDLLQAHASMDPTEQKLTDESFIAIQNRLQSLSDVRKRTTIQEDEVTQERIERDSSILLTVPNFDSLSFLTFAHSSASVGDLRIGLNNIKDRKDDQIEKQEDTVRIHFPLFSRCAGGIDLLGNNAEHYLDQKTSNTNLVDNHMDRIESLVDRSAELAKLSFKPLLDNASEVRKTKTALNVLNKIKPFLDIPSQMKQSIDAEKFGVTIKAYRQVMTIDDNYAIDILRSVKRKSTEVACEARARLEAIIADPNVPLGKLLDSIYHLGILISWNVTGRQTGNSSSASTYKQMRQTLNYSPALGCLVMQANHFSCTVSEAINDAKEQLDKIVEMRERAKDMQIADETFQMANEAIQKMARSVSNQSSTLTEYDLDDSIETESKWKHEILNVRLSTVLQIVKLAKTWLPRLVRLGVTTRETEVFQSLAKKEIKHSAYEAFVGDFAEALFKLIQHAAFCSLGSSGSRRQLVMSIGSNFDKEVQSQLTKPLPPDLNDACSKELVSLADVVRDCHTSASIMRPSPEEGCIDVDLESNMLRLDACVSQVNAAVDIAERRVCSNALDACSKHCVGTASSGKLDIDALRSTVVNELATLSNPISYTTEIEEGAREIIMRSCAALSSYATAHDDEASLFVVAEYARALSKGIPNVVREIVDLVHLHNETTNLTDLLSDDVVEAEERHFEIYLNSIRKKVRECVKIGWINLGIDNVFNKKEINYDALNFPGYLSNALLAVVHFKAELFKVFRGLNRKSAGDSYEMIGITVAVEECVTGIWSEMDTRISNIDSIRANMLAAELKFLMKTLNPYLSNTIINDGQDWIERLLSMSEYNDPRFVTSYFDRLNKLGEVYRVSLAFNAAATEL